MRWTRHCKTTANVDQFNIRQQWHIDDHSDDVWDEVGQEKHDEKVIVSRTNNIYSVATN